MAKIISKNKFVLALTIQNLVNDNWEFKELENGKIQIINDVGEIVDTIGTEKALQDFVDDMSLNF